jgi:hypothetical protein
MNNLRTRSTTSLFALALAAAMAAAPVGLAAAADTPAAAGSVVALDGTANLWIADAQGTLHLAGDTRAVTGKAVNWQDRTRVSLDTLRGAQMGTPWLSLPLVRIGDALYLPKWESDAAAPTLYRVTAPADLPLYGLDPNDATTVILDQPAWEQRSGLAVASLAKADLASLVAAPPAASGAATGESGGALSHSPTLGTDVTFAFPPGRGWTDGGAVSDLSSVLVQNGLPGEQVLGIARVLDAPPNGAYVYLITSAVPLGQHPEIQTVADLADTAVRQVCQSPDSCQTTSGGAAGTIGAQAVAMRDFHVDRNLQRDIGLSGITNESDSRDTASTLDLYSHAVFLLHGNYGYAFRLTSADPAALASREGDLTHMVETLAFAN